MNITWSELKVRVNRAEQGQLNVNELEELITDLDAFINTQVDTSEAQEASKAVDLINKKYNELTDEPTSSNHRRRLQLGAVKIKLSSPTPSNVKDGIEQVTKWLSEDLENQDIYKFLFDMVKENPASREEIRNLLQGMIQRGSKSAADTLNDLDTFQKPPFIESKLKNEILEETTEEILLSDVQKKLLDADNAYYLGDYINAIRLYQQVILLEPENQRALEQLPKAELNRASGRLNPDLPRQAVEYYRRARSYIAARDFKSAEKMLNVAMDEAQAKGTRFPEADIALNDITNLSTATEYKEKAEIAIQKENWEEALRLFDSVIRLDPYDATVKNLREGLQKLLEAEALLDPFSFQRSSEIERNDKLTAVASSLKSVEKIKDLISTARFKSIFAKHDLYKADAQILQKWGPLKALAPQENIKNKQKIAREILGSNDPSLKYVEEQLGRYIPLRIGAAIILIVIIVAVIMLGGTFLRWVPTEIIENTPTPLSTPTISIIQTNIPTDTPNPSFTPSATAKITSSATPTSAPAMSPTPFAIGYVNVVLVHPLKEPNGKWVGGYLERNQVVTILEKKIDHTDTWYYCQWEVNGVTNQGWILMYIIQIGPTPTPQVWTTPKP